MNCRLLKNGFLFMFLYFYHFFAIFAVKQLIKKKRFDIMQKVEKLIGVSPSGKATDSDSVIREFKSLHPSQTKRTGRSLFFLFFLRSG